jgi:thiamine pyrophosphokinase
MRVAVCCAGEKVPKAWVEQVLASTDAIIAADGGLEMVLGAGKTADLWVGDGDSISDQIAPVAHSLLWLEKDKDDTDGQRAVREAGLRYPGCEIIVIGGGGGRLDHLWAMIDLVSKTPNVRYWLTAHDFAVIAGPGVTLPIPPGRVSVLALNRPLKVASKALQWPLEALDWESEYSLSNVAAQGASLKVVEGRALVVGEPSWMKELF